MPDSKNDFTPGFRRCSGFIFAQMWRFESSQVWEGQPQNPPRRHSVAEPQPKTKIHHGGTETRRRSKPIFTTEDTEKQSHNQNHSLPQRTRRNTKRTETKAYRRGRKGSAEGAEQNRSNKNLRKKRRNFRLVLHPLTAVGQAVRKQPQRTRRNTEQNLKPKRRFLDKQILCELCVLCDLCGEGFDFLCGP